MAENRLIRSWQGIADFFHVRSRQTVKRWDKILAMPIVRTPGGVVMARSGELVEWLNRFQNIRRI